MTAQEFFKNDLFAENAGVVLLEVRKGYSKAKLEIKPEHLNAGARTQGGAIFTLADLALAAAANSHGTLAFSLSSTITFLRASGPGDTLFAEARERYIGRSTGCYQVDITNQDGELIATFESSVFRSSGIKQESASTLLKVYLLETDNADDTDKKIINPCHPRYPRLKNNRLAGPFTSDMPSFFLYIYLTIEVSGCRLPVTLFRNAFAEPKFRNKSRRTGRWFKSSVTKKVITSFSFPFLSYSTNEKIRQR